MEDYAVLEHVTGQAHIGLGNIDVGLVHLRNASKSERGKIYLLRVFLKPTPPPPPISVEVLRETWVMPYALLAVAQAELKKDLVSCEAALNQAETFHSKAFDFDGRHKIACKKVLEERICFLLCLVTFFFLKKKVREQLDAKKKEKK